MATFTIPAPATLPAGEIVAVDVSAEDYMVEYAETFHEWVRGVVIKMSPVSGKHDDLTAYLRYVLDTYFAFNPVGRARSAPFVMRLAMISSNREPDIQVILNANPGDLTDTAMIGPADICIEVVSPESATRDYGEKLIEYEQAGVREYWIVDPLRQACHFHRLQEAGLYAPVSVDDGAYTTPLLPHLIVDVPTLWQALLPTTVETMDAIRAMFAPDGENEGGDS